MNEWSIEEKHDLMMRSYYDQNPMWCLYTHRQRLRRFQDQYNGLPQENDQ